MSNKIVRTFMAALCAASIMFANPVTVTWANVTYTTPGNSNFKAYMDYRTITCKSSDQFKLQQKCTTSADGFRMYDGRYTVAIGTGYDAPVGTYIDVELETGNVLKCIVGEIKKNIDTYSNNKQCKHNNSVIEFIVDCKVLSKNVKKAGSAHVLKGMSGNVVKLTRYTDNNISKPVKSKGNTRTVLSKFTMEVDDTVLYFVEYASESNYDTKQVSKKTYNSIKAGVSTIKIK